jgi:sugar phosphate permease
MSASPATSSHGEVNPKEVSSFVDEEKAPVTPTTENHSNVNTADEDKLVRKIDLHLLPILFVLYMFAFLDRVNIGNAKIQGLTTELHMSGEQYNIASMILFVPYIVLEVPSNLLMKRIKPSMWLSGLMFGWGIITMCQGFVSSYGGLLACRVLLGVFEAGVFPGKDDKILEDIKFLTI